MYINPIDISIALLLSIMIIIGIKNGIIDEFKKTINFFLSIICTKFIVSYLSNSFLNNNFIQLIAFIIILIMLLYVLGFIINMIIYNLDSVKIEKNINKTLGGMFGPIRGLLIIVMCIVAFKMFPIQESQKDRLLLKLNNDSILFNFSNNIKQFLLE